MFWQEINMSLLILSKVWGCSCSFMWLHDKVSEKWTFHTKPFWFCSFVNSRYPPDLFETNYVVITFISNHSQSSKLLGASTVTYTYALPAPTAAMKEKTTEWYLSVSCSGCLTGEMVQRISNINTLFFRHIGAPTHAHRWPTSWTVAFCLE